MARDPKQQVQAIALRIAQQVQKSTGKGVQAAVVFLSARLKEIVSTPAPRKRVVNSAGDIRYVATVRAIYGAPPRKLSGKLRQTITHAIRMPAGGVMGGKPSNGPFGSKRPVTTKIQHGVVGVVGVKARSNLGFNYPRHLEQRTSHRYMGPTLRRYKRDLARIVGGPINARIT